MPILITQKGSCCLLTQEANLMIVFSKFFIFMVPRLNDWIVQRSYNLKPRGTAGLPDERVTFPDFLLFRLLKIRSSYAGMPFEELAKCPRIFKAQFVSDLFSRFIGIENQPLGFHDDPLLDNEQRRFMIV